MIVDCSLYFDELDLLKLRLEYLSPFVDKFVIVEAAQTFSGNPKPYNLESNLPALGKFCDKIEYIKIPGDITSYSDLHHRLSDDSNTTSKLILEFINEHQHYDKNTLRWLLDSYHRECLHYAIQMLDDNDICILSDIDEIPNISLIDLKKLKTPLVCVQHMFSYFVNFYSHSNWKGSIISKAKWMKTRSLNSIRLASHSDTDKQYKYVNNAGYHFSSIGKINDIRTKMNSWAHQELNTITNQYTLNFNLRHGHDIFNRSIKRTYDNVSLESDVFDQRMAKLLTLMNFEIGDNIYEKSILQKFLVLVFWFTNFIEKNHFKLKEKVWSKYSN